MDKFILLTYTYIAGDGFRHSGHAWFETEQDMRSFICNSKCCKIEVDTAVKILLYKELKV